MASVAMAQLNDAKQLTDKECDICFLSILCYEMLWCDNLAALKVTEAVWPEWQSIWHIQMPTELNHLTQFWCCKKKILKNAYKNKKILTPSR